MKGAKKERSGGFGSESGGGSSGGTGSGRGKNRGRVNDRRASNAPAREAEKGRSFLKEIRQSKSKDSDAEGCGCGWHREGLKGRCLRQGAFNHVFAI